MVSPLGRTRFSRAGFVTSASPIRMSAERKGVRLYARVEESDLKRMIHDRAGIANKLIKPLCRNDALPVRINVSAVRGAWRRSIYRDPKAHWTPVGGRTEDEMQVTRVEAIDDAAILFVQERALIADRPVAGKRPLVQLWRARCIDVTRILN